MILLASVGATVNQNGGTWSWRFDSDDGPAESQTVTVSGDDGNGGTAAVMFELTVDNVGGTGNIGAVGNLEQGNRNAALVQLKKVIDTLRTPMRPTRVLISQHRKH